MEGASITRMDSYQYPAAHLGHLGPEQERALEKFKQLSQEKGYYRPAADGKPASHDDENLLRFLRARKWIPTEAFGQFKDTSDWRKENEIEKLYDTIDVKDYEACRRLYPQWTGRRDRRGIPVYVFEVAHLNHKAVSAYESSTTKPQSIHSKVPPKMLRLFALYENLTNFVFPLCSALPDRPYPETPISQSNNIVDISKVGLKQFWNLKNHMQDASTLATAYYPETLDRIFIIGAPSFFPTVWGWIKRWFDPITVSKIFILSHADMKSTLEKYIAIENIPKKYGGTLDYSFGDLPNLDPLIDQSMHWERPQSEHGRKTIPTGPIRWRRTGNDTLTAIAMGTEHGKPRDTKIADLKETGKVAPASLGVGDQSGEEHLDLLRTTSGIHTQPETPPESVTDLDPPPRGNSETPLMSETAPNGLGSTLPIRSTSSEYSAPVREGTSATRYEQQKSTLAHGQLAAGTPNMKTSGDGDTHGVMEPNTVAQAPKEHPQPEPEMPVPSYLDQAKTMAGQAYGTAQSVAGAAMEKVGLAKPEDKTEDKTEDEAASKVIDDPEVDNAPERTVEEMLRGQYRSEASKEAENKKDTITE